jgi:maltose/moltooligosaccharide transporter
MSTLALTAPGSVRTARAGAYLISFAAAAVGAGAGRAVTTTYLPVLLDRIDDAPGLIGLVMLVNAGAGFSVPLVVGYWSDRRRAQGLGARMPFVVGGSLLGAGGLVAVALGASSSYLALAVFAATVYVGLNAVTTAHRALVAELFASGERARATSAQELALLAGGLLGLGAGGVLADVALWAPFAAAALLLPLTALPTLLRVAEPHADAHERQDRHALRYYLAVATSPGVRALLLAEWLWVLGYAALPAFFVLYAEKVLGLSLSRASLVLAAFGLVTAAAMLAAGRVKRPELLRPLLLLGIGLMGGGLLAVPLTTNLVATAPALIAAAAGFGIVSTVGFPFLASMIPEGEAGAYTALFFSVRAIASTVALPLAGGLIALTGSYRTLFVLGGAVTLLGLVALAGIHVPRHRPRPVWALRWTASLAALYAVLLATGVLIAGTSLQAVDEMLFRWINALGPGPELLFEVLEEPARNYALLATVILAAALLTRTSRLRRLVALEVVSVGLAVGLLQALYAVFDRPRPSEVFERTEIALAYGRNWASIESFPSGHMAVVTALAAAAWLAMPQLRGILIAYVALNAVTRVSFGAHFPADVLAGAALGYGSALAGRSLLSGRSTERGEANSFRSRTPLAFLRVLSARLKDASCRQPDREAQEASDEHVRPEVNPEIHAGQGDHHRKREEGSSQPRMEHPDCGGGRKRRRGMTRGKRRGVRERDQRFDCGVRQGRARALGHLLQQHGQAFGERRGSGGRERSNRKPTLEGVAAAAGDREERPLDPPGRGDHEDHREGPPVNAV